MKTSLFCRMALAAGGTILFGGLVAPVSADVAYVSYLNNTIERYSSTGGGSVFASGVSSPAGLAYDHTGNLFVVCKTGGSSKIERITPGGVKSVFASNGLNDPAGLAFDSAGNLYVANEGNSTIEKFTPGGVSSVFASSGLSDPVGLAFDNAGNLYATNADCGAIEKFTPGGVGSVFASGGLLTPRGLAFDRAGNLYVACVGKIEKYTPSGVGSVFSQSIFAADPVSIAFDSEGNLYTSDYALDEVIKFTPSGVGSVFASGLDDPWGIAFTNDAGVPLPLPPTTTPEPSTLALLGTGALGLLAYACRKTKGSGSLYAWAGKGDITDFRART